MARLTLGCVLLLVVAVLIRSADVQNLASQVFGMAEYRAFFGTRVAPICTPLNLRTIATCSNWLGLYCTQVGVCTAPLAARVQTLETNLLAALTRVRTLETNLTAMTTRFNTLITDLEAANQTLFGPNGTVSGVTGLLDLVKSAAEWASNPTIKKYNFTEDIISGDSDPHAGKMSGTMMLWSVTLPSLPLPTFPKGTGGQAMAPAPVQTAAPMLWQIELNIQITSETSTTSTVANVKWGAITKGAFTDLMPAVLDDATTDAYTTPKVFCSVSNIRESAGSPAIAYSARFTRNDIQLEAIDTSTGDLVEGVSYPAGTTIFCRNLAYAAAP